MYSEKITQRRIEMYEAEKSVKLRELPVDRVREIVTYLEGKPDSTGNIVRPVVTHEFRAFIENEYALCKSSFIYWARRYAFIAYRDGTGGIKLFNPLESQTLLLEKLAIAEEENWARFDAGDKKFMGMCFMIHKARQLGFTTLCQLLLLHLAIFWSDKLTLSASTDDQKTQDMHAKWSLAYNRLPYWMQVGIEQKEKDRGKNLSNGSYCALQDFSQKSGLGQGMTWGGIHLTEVAKVPDEYCRDQIQNHLLPSIDDTLSVIAFMESTAQGAGNWWHQFWLQVEAGRAGRWRDAFIPAYAEPTRWSRPYVPEGWKPKEDTLAYEQSVIRTSHKYMNGRTIHPIREHLLWWEEERDTAIETGTLNLWLANHCATPEESFQYAEGGAFNPQIISSLDSRIDKSTVAYELVSTASQRAAVRERMNTDKDAPRILSAGGVDLVPVRTTSRDEKDPRGLIMLFELPRTDINYSIGVDPAVGLVGWNRRFRSDDKDELKKDNACISGWYRDPVTSLIVQAFEFAAPVSARELAVYCAALGRVYSGTHGPERGSPLIIELNNGGVEVQNVLVNDFRYYSLWQRTKSDGLKSKQIEQWGWNSNQQTVRELWIYGKDMIEQPSMPIRPRSSYLVKEMGLARWDPVRGRGEVPEGNGQHDDRLSAMLFALWQLRGFMPSGSYGEAVRAAAKSQHRTKADFQTMDIASRDDYEEVVDVWYNRVLYGE
jgi:hypothetical protein